MEYLIIGSCVRYRLGGRCPRQNIAHTSIADGALPMFLTVEKIIRTL